MPPARGGGGRPAPPQAGKGDDGRSKLWRIVCAVAYELRPFTPPTRHDAAQFYHSTRRTLRLLAQEGAALLRCLRAAAAHLSWRRVLPLAVYLGLQWLAARVEFGLVFFIVAMLALIFTVGLGDDASRQTGERLSPWSVFNTGMRTMLGALDPAQFEAEIRNYGLEQGGLGDQLLLRRGGNGNGDEAQSPPQQRQPPGQGGGGGAGEGERERERGGPARKTGKKARRIFDKEERRRRRMGGAGAGGAGGGQGEMWEEDWLSDED